MLIQVSSSLQANGIEVRQYGAVSSDAAMLASNQLDQATGVNFGQNGVCQNDTCDNDLIWVDPASCCYALFSKLDANKVLLQQSPLALAKALKVVDSLTFWLNLSLELHRIYLFEVSSNIVKILEVRTP